MANCSKFNQEIIPNRCARWVSYGMKGSCTFFKCIFITLLRFLKVICIIDYCLKIIIIEFINSFSKNSVQKLKRDNPLGHHTLFDHYKNEKLKRFGCLIVDWLACLRSKIKVTRSQNTRAKNKQPTQLNDTSYSINRDHYKVLNCQIILLNLLVLYIFIFRYGKYSINQYVTYPFSQ